MFEYAWKLQNRVESRLHDFSENKYYDIFLMEVSLFIAAVAWFLAYGDKML